MLALAQLVVSLKLDIALRFVIMEFRPRSGVEVRVNAPGPKTFLVGFESDCTTCELCCASNIWDATSVNVCNVCGRLGVS